MGFMSPIPLKKKAEEEEPSNFGLARVFKYEELKKATNSFDTELGVGAFGRVYLGKLPGGREVAVKVLFDDPKRVEQFFNEVTALPRLRHKNLITLYGCTNPLSHGFLLVYDYVPNGTVAEHLHGKRSDLTLDLRIQIAVETVEALSYLHALEPPIIHRDVKTSNILLDNALHVKVADLGICRHLPWDTTHVSTQPQGTVGYRDPEYDRTFVLTDKSDVYSLGVVLMELMSGQQAVDVKRDPIYLDNLALKKKLKDFVDPKLGYHSNRDVKRVIMSVAELARKCLRPNGRMRPSMVQVLSILKEIQNKMLERGQTVVDVMSFGPPRDLGYGSLNEVSDTSLSPQQEFGDGSLNNERHEIMKGIQVGPNKVDVISSDPQRELSDGSLALNIGVEVVMTDLGGGGGDGNEQKKPVGDQKPKPPQASTVVLKIDLHCEGCTKWIVKTIRKVKGVDRVTVKDEDLVTVTGIMDMETFPTLLQEKLKNKRVEVVLQKKDDSTSKGGKKKTDGGGGEEEGKKNEGGGGSGTDKKKDGSVQEEEKKNEGGGGGGADKKEDGSSGIEEKKKVDGGVGDADKKEEGGGGGGEEKKKESGGGGGANKKECSIDGGEERKNEGGSGGGTRKRDGDIGGGEEKKKEGGCGEREEKENEGSGGGGMDKKTSYNGGGEEKKKEGGMDKKKEGGGEKEEGKVAASTMSKMYYHMPHDDLYQIEMVHAPQMFSDENPNACSIM